MRALFWLLALFAIAAALAVAGRFNEGYVLLVVPPYRVELSLNFFVVLVFAAFVLLYALMRLVTNTLRMPEQVRRFRSRKQREKSAQLLRDAFRLLFEGRYGHALKAAEQAYAADETQGLAALVAARAAHAMRDRAREGQWLARAQDAGPELRTARLMTEAELHVEARRYEEAADSLRALQQGGQRHIAALRLALRTSQATGDWEGVLRLVRQLEKHKVLTPEQASPIRRRAHLENIGARRQDAPALARYWGEIPASERSDARLAAAAARGLIAAGDCAAAQAILESLLDNAWDDALVEIYGECREGDALGRITRAESWLRARPRDARLLLTLGRLCRIQQLWGKAQSYLEASLAVEPSRAAYLELAQLCDELGRSDEANRHYRAAAGAPTGLVEA